MGRHIVFSSVVCLSVRLSVCLSVTLSCPLYIFWTPGGIYKYLCTNITYDETMCSVYVWPRSVQCQGHNLRLNIVWLYFVSTLYLLNPRWVLQITLHTCQIWWDDVQCLCLTKVGSRSRSQSKIKHCLAVFRDRLISFEPLVGLTNNFAQMSAMLRRCAVPMFDQNWFTVKVRI